MRTAQIKRKTRETDIELAINLDEPGSSSISTGVGFMDHMLELLARHGFISLQVKVSGDLEVDAHHTMEDLGLVLGQAISEALGDRAGICRYGSCLLPMDEARALAAVDLSNRPYLVYEVNTPAATVGGIDVALFHEFFQALAVKAGMNCHIVLERAGETHHAIEAIFKAFARALAQAVAFDPRLKGQILSTKGSL